MMHMPSEDRNGGFVTVVSAPCQHFTQLNFMIPEAYRMCKHPKMNAQNCPYANRQQECLLYEPDSNFPNIFQFQQLGEKLDQLNKHLEQGPQHRNTVREAYRVATQLSAMSKGCVDLFGGWSHLHYRFEQERLRRQLSIGEQILEIARSMFR